MLKLFFWLLLAVNGALFAFHQGYLGGDGAPRETSRLAQQLRADKIRLLSESSARAATAPLFASAAPAPAPASASSPAPAVAADAAPNPAACIEIGDFGAADSQRFAAQLAALGLQQKASARSVAGEAASYMVYIPAPAERAALDKKLAELRQLDVKDFFVLPQTATLAGGISLGVFKTEEGARTQLASLNKKGVRGARIHARGAGRQAFQLRGLDQREQAVFEQLRAEFPEQGPRACAAVERAAG